VGDVVDDFHQKALADCFFIATAFKTLGVIVGSINFWEEGAFRAFCLALEWAARRVMEIMKDEG
jgi:hypothetical protein